MTYESSKTLGGNNPSKQPQSGSLVVSMAHKPSDVYSLSPLPHKIRGMNLETLDARVAACLALAIW